jgi:hypothetical protein
MQFDHERLDVYRVALDFLVLAERLKRRYCDTARGSATESAALLDVYLRLTLASEDDHRSGKDMLLRIVSMLVQLAKSLEKR